MSDHVQHILTSCSQTVYALKTLRAHGMPTPALQNIYRSVILAKVLYASSAWSGFTTQTERNRIDAFLQRERRSGLCPADAKNFGELCNAADDKLFKTVLSNRHHPLHILIPEKSVSFINYNLRCRPHDRKLPDITTQLAKSNFISRQLYANSY
jgi:hypothetical protein